MSKQHTPGPWFPHKRPEPIGYAEYEIHYGTSGECVAEVVHGEGNANLLAAAPHLLAAARQALEECADLMATPAGDALAYAIARATGSAA